MPEGPEIRRSADRIERAVAGHELIEVFFAFDRLKSHEESLRGQTVETVDTHGKAMLTRLSGGLTLYSHNQLYGRWYIRRPGRPGSTRRSLRVALRTAHRDALLYSASDVDLLDSDGLAQHAFLRRLGPDALCPRTDWQEIDQRLRSKDFRGRQLGGLLLDQSFVAGLGNYLRAEILFAAKLDPGRRPRDLNRSERQRLARRVLSVPRRSYRTGGVTALAGWVRELSRQGLSRRALRFAVFGRASQPCRACGARIRRGNHSGRRIYWCPSCQA